MGCVICNVELIIVKDWPPKEPDGIQNLATESYHKQLLPSYEKKILERQGWIWNRNDDATRPLLPTAWPYRALTWTN